MDVEAELTMVSDAAVPMFAQPVVPQGAEPVQQMACPHVAQPLQALQPAVAGIEQQPAVVQPVPAVPMVTQPEQAVEQPEAFGCSWECPCTGGESAKAACSDKSG